MVPSYRINDDQEIHVENLYDDPSLTALLERSVATPPASDWSDLSIRDGAGSDEGDTYKYECLECRVGCASMAELCTHLSQEASVHVVCPVCLKEFHGTRKEREEQKRVHMRGHHKQGTTKFTLRYARNDGKDQDQEIPNRIAALTPMTMPHIHPTDCDDREDTKSTNMDQENVSAAMQQKQHVMESEARKSSNGLSLTDDNENNISEDAYDADKSRMSSDETNEGTLDSTGDTVHPMDNVAEHLKKSATIGRNLPYYHWEPDTFYTELRKINVDRLKKERKQEMMWLMDFEGA